MHRRRKAIHAFWTQQNEAVEHILARPTTTHLFMQKLYDALSWTKADYAAFIRRQQSFFETSLIETRRSAFSHAEIPSITHRIWVTSLEDPKQPPASYVENYLNMTRALPAEVMHYFWTNSFAVASVFHEKASAAGCTNINIVDTALLGRDHVMMQVHRLIEARKFVLAVDMLKFIVLERYGGIYSDLGIVYDEEIFDLIRMADYAFIFDGSGFFQTSFIACAPGSELATICLAIMNVPSALDPSYALTGSEVTAIDEVNMLAGPGMTTCTILFMPKSSRMLLLPAQSKHLLWHSQQSWYGEQPKHGNVLIGSTGPTLVGKDEFRRSDAVFASSVHMFGNDSFLRAQLRILIPLQEYFSTRPTHFCKNFFFHGSDKAMHWHNYGYIYNFLLGRMGGDVRNILEIGIGTDNLDVPSTMGVSGVPGASLRAWKETFPLATVVGADIDIRILFQELGIETYWVDQTREDAVRQLFDNIGLRQFDLIIDDGLHTFAANRTLMDGAYKHVTKMGMYIIEDVLKTDIGLWEAYLAEAGYNAALIQIPHESNHSDNCLILIPGGQNPSS